MLVLECVFAAIVLLLALPVCVLALQVIVASARRGGGALPSVARPSVALLVPAHNAAATLGGTLASVRSQLQAGDRLLVVADHCSDDSAAVARAAGTQVIERRDGERHGAGDALAFGMQHLCASPPDVVIVLEAGCRLQPGALAWLARTCGKTGRPVQAACLPQVTADAGPAAQVAQFAWTVRHWLRPQGWRRLGLGCQLLGGAMAFPWPLLCGAPLANRHPAEYLKLGLELALAGSAPLFCERALIHVAPGAPGQASQAEHGHLALIAAYGPRLFRAGLRRRDLGLLAQAADLCVPPVSLLLLLAAAAGACGALAWLARAAALPWGAALVLPAVLGGTLLLAWHKCGRHFPLGHLAHALAYVGAKIPGYARWFGRRAGGSHSGRDNL